MGFMRMFPDEGACAAYLESVRWPDGFVCRFCLWTGEPYRFSSRPLVLRCPNCREDTSLTVDTVMQRTRTPLAAWFLAAYLVTTGTPGVSALQLQRQLDLKRYETAFQILHKLRAVMVRPFRDRIGGPGKRVEVDETLVGGRTRGKGRGQHQKVSVIGAVEVKQLTNKRGKRTIHAGRLRLRMLPVSDGPSFKGFINDAIEPGGTVITDGASMYRALPRYGHQQERHILRGDHDKADAGLPMVHIVFSNLKAWLLGTHHGVSKKHLPAYLNEFVFRFNRRAYPFSAFNGVLGLGFVAESPTYKSLYSGDWHHPSPNKDANA